MSSFIPEGTNVICTNMTNGSPQKIGLHHKCNIVYKGKNAPLLNELDRKISEAFDCKNNSKFWDGFAALALGIAVGALIVVAIVATGGAAGVILAATVAATTSLALTTAAVAGAAAAAFWLTGKFTSPHACDATLSSEWTKGTLHEKVLLNGKPAVLNTSTISCKKGGLVSIVIDDATAEKAAEEMSKNNNQELFEHVKAEFFIGVVNGVAFTAFPSVIGVCIGGGIATYDYAHNQSERQDREREHIETTRAQDIASAKSDNEKYLPVASTGDVTSDYLEVRKDRIKESNEFGEQADEAGAESGKMQSQADDFGKTAAEREAQGGTESSVQSAKLAQDMSQNSADEFGGKAAGLTAKSEEALASSRNVGSVLKSVNWAHIARGFGIGVAAAVASFYIDDHYYDKEKDLQKETAKASAESALDDIEKMKDNHATGQILALTK